MEYPFSIPQEIAKEPICTIFSRDFFLSKKIRFDKYKVEALPFCQNNHITLEKLFEVLPIRAFCRHLVKDILTEKQAQWFALDCAKFALPCFEYVYPYDDRVRNHINLSEQYLLGKVDIGTLIIKRATVDISVGHAANAVYAARTARNTLHTSIACAACDAAVAAADAHAASSVRAAADATQDDFKPFVENWLKNLLKHQNN
jgi:hypothetical protein